ncbi:PREDICTED: uncharacterized protein LOC109464812 [Branchiostoma belcheri]|uniref:Uncharacterized protein LOC109464812 n=1 Tax=Branchiostoma belcheri TaxID=7741 RepID=A0A6P4XZ70_BRABE|nr:PREDICTED: uncharacterized protein LOC109464812 [Branchiostoma belcheri]
MLGALKLGGFSKGRGLLNRLNFDVAASQQEEVSKEQATAENHVLISETLYWPKPPTAMVIRNRLWTGLPITEAKETTYTIDKPKKLYLVECNVFLDENVEQCDYSDPRSGVSWACVKPKTLPCSSRADHKVDYDLSGRLNKLCFFLTASQKNIINSLVTYDEEKGGTFKKTIKGSPESINVKSYTDVPISVSMRRPPCGPGIPASPSPTTGFWQKDVWTSTVCRNRHFLQREHYFRCLKNKELYFMGDSTGRQLYEFLLLHILNTTFSAADPSITRRAGPHYAVHKPSNLTLRFRVHGPPLRTGGINVSHINYLAKEINSVRGGPGYVLIITMWAHFTSFHYEIYIQRLRAIRTAVINLLHRKPGTLVVFKTASTRTGVPRLSSDFFSSQMNKIIRKMFENVVVTILDVWDMTLSHKNEDIIHPKKEIIRQEVELLLSYICPSQNKCKGHIGGDIANKMTTAHVQLVTLLVSWCACTAQQFSGDPTVCVPCNPCGALPNIPQSFEAKIEVNIQNGNETYDVEEHFDGENNRAVVYMTRQGRTGKQILNFNGGEVYDIIGTQCVAQQLEAGEDLFGYIPAPNGTHIFSSVVTFGMASRLGVTEMGRTTVRGIPVVNYRACTYWPQWDTTFIADYYFSTPEFQLAGGDPVIPVRVTVSGKGRKPNAKPGEGRRDFSRTYEYMYFRSSLRADWSVFETPRGVECHHRQSQETFPDIPNHQHYVQEQILPQQQIVDGLEIWYNYDQQLLRLDYVAFTSTFQPQEGRFGVPKRVIHDFNTGLEYETDLSTGACTMRRIVDSPLQLLDNSNGVMLTPAQTLSLDGVQKYYMGKHLVRNILADGWIYRRQFNFSAGPMWVEYQLYFSSSEYVDHTGFADNTRVPLHIEFKPITVPGNYTGPMDKTVIKIYNFDLDQDITDFAVSNCYDASRKQVIRFQFPVSVSPLLKLYGRELTLQTKIQLCRAMGISFLRCEDVMYDSDNSATYVTMTVLEAPAVSPGPRDQPLTPTADAIMLLQQKIDSNQLVITLSRDIQITAISGTLQQDVYDPPSNIICRPNKARQRDVSATQTASSSTTSTNSGCDQGVQNSASGFSAGTLAGVAVALLVSGVILGLAVQYIIVRQRMKSAESAGLTSRMEMPDISSLPAAIPD